MNGIITGEEYNSNLMGRRALRTWDEMRKSDATTKMTLKAINEPVKAMPWYIQPASDEPKDLEVAAFINATIFEILRWKTSLGEILTHFPFGHSVHEKVYQFCDVLGTDRWTLSKLAFRKQSSIAKWETADGQPGVTQYGSKGLNKSIPLERLVVFTNEQEGDNYEGVSGFRAAYKHWYYKDKLYQIDAIGHERQALGVVKIKYPKNAKKEEKEAAKAAARNLRANEEASILEPELWDINFMDMKAGSLKDTMPSIEHHDRQIAVNVLAQFMNLGSTSGSGSRAVGEPQMKLFEQSVKAIADYIADTVNQYVIKDLVDLNFNVTEYPKLSAGDIGGESLSTIATSIKTLVDAGVIHPTEEDETYMRGRLGLPDLPDDEDAEAEPEEEETKPAPTKEASARRTLAASISSRDIPDLYEGTGVDPDDLGCIMLDTDPLSVLEHVEGAEADLADAGALDRSSVPGEDATHITLLYGLLENGNVWKDKVDAVLDGWSLPSVTIDHIGYFELGEKIAIVAHIAETPELVDGHERLTLLPHIQTFSEYKPHLTLAYVKPDQEIAEKWVEALNAQYAGTDVNSTGINYGDKPDAGKNASAFARARSVLASLRERIYGRSRSR